MIKQPIGIFDSGVGGLTVFKEVRRKFPFEDIVYFGDTARVPYGPKSPRTIIEYSIQNARFLLQCGAKIIVVACNTSAAVALPELQKILSVPVIEVIEPGALSAVKKTHTKRIGVIGTEGTIRSGAYAEAISKIDSEARVFSQACPLFVSLAEEGWEDHPVTKLVIEEYLTPLLKNKIDTLVLGCTHYPILKKALMDFVGKGIKLVDSAEAVTEQLQKVLEKTDLETSGTDKFYVSDNEEKFRLIASRILNKEIETLINVKLGESWYLT
ncbi:MAG: glutamate racemase [Candidatus Cloacimonadales bacterium]|nr:glutamate racemase [Candidatus Cloacimonadales bacterium]